MKKDDNLKDELPFAGSISADDMMKGVVLPLFIGFLVPGAGHLYLKDKKRGMLIFVLLLITFFSGILMQGKLYTPSFEGTRWDNVVSLLATVAELGNGMYYLVSLVFADVEGNLPSVYYEVGSVYCITAGLLNILVLFSLFDLIRMKRKEKSPGNFAKIEKMREK